jgi:molybdopterin molybdotransferase
MPEFLQLLPPPEALALLLEKMPFLPPPPAERIDTASALGRVTAEAITAAESLPSFARSTMDGYAVRSSDTFGASDSLPVYLTLAGEVPMGGQPRFSIRPGECGLIHTGGMLPDGSDAVVMLENTQLSRPGEIEVMRAAAAAENIIRVGEDLQVGQLVLPAGVRLRPAEIGGLMALGLHQVLVAKMPRIGILSSGDEVVPAEVQPLPGQVRDVNSYTLRALVEQYGGQAVTYGIVPDRAEMLGAALDRAIRECDAVMITAGSSASARDLTAEVIQRMGPPGVLVHGVNVRPGKPTILAVCNGKAVIGLPGNPVSALVIAGLFVVPVIERLLGRTVHRPRASVPARLTVNLASQAGREDWTPVKLLPGSLAEPIFYKSNLIFTLARADGFVVIPADATGLAAGELVEVILS